jgi:opacity protein-like surface antigen
MRTKKIAFSLAAALLALSSGSALAQEWYADGEWYVGGGVSSNRLGGFDNATGFQLFAGYEFTNLRTGAAAIMGEFGYFRSGDFERRQLDPLLPDKVSADGLWASAVMTYPLADRFLLLGRIGLDFGDDDGLLLGAGIAYRFNPTLDLRGEYVARPDVNSLQANITIRF